MVNSMTGYASGRGQDGVFSWSWDLRAVNARGLDLRLRVPDWINGLEQNLRKGLAARLGRGSVTLSLRLVREETAEGLSLNETQLGAVLGSVARIESLAAEADLALAPSTAADLLMQRGVLETTTPDENTSRIAALLSADFETLLEAFCEMRAAEGQALSRIISGQLDRVDDLVVSAAAAAEERRGKVSENLRANLARVLENADGVDETRLAQELALLAVKADVTEEIDRLRAHVDAARALLGSKRPIGRKLDFLMQEFMREANTLCSKSQSTALTALGLDLKVTIDQMREQVQNVE